MACKAGIQIEDLPMEMETLSPERTAAVRGGEQALTHETTHTSNNQTMAPPTPRQGIIAILIG
jgi:hypothetical protein